MDNVSYDSDSESGGMVRNLDSPKMNWSSKSKNVDLFFCTNPLCRVITFIEGTANNLCPRCHEPGSLVRSEKLLSLGIRST